MTEIRDTLQDAEGDKEERYRKVASPLPIHLGGLGSVISFPSGVRGGAQPKMHLVRFELNRTHLWQAKTSKWSIAFWSAAWRSTHLDVKSGQGWEFGTIQRPEWPHIFSGQALKIRDGWSPYARVVVSVSNISVLRCYPDVSSTSQSRLDTITSTSRSRDSVVSVLSRSWHHKRLCCLGLGIICFIYNSACCHRLSFIYFTTYTARGVLFSVMSVCLHECVFLCLYPSLSVCRRVSVCVCVSDTLQWSSAER